MKLTKLQKTLKSTNWSYNCRQSSSNAKIVWRLTSKIIWHNKGFLFSILSSHTQFNKNNKQFHQYSTNFRTIKLNNSIDITLYAYSKTIQCDATLGRGGTVSGEGGGEQSTTGHNNSNNELQHNSYTCVIILLVYLIQLLLSTRWKTWENCYENWLLNRVK